MLRNFRFQLRSLGQAGDPGLPALRAAEEGDPTDNARALVDQVVWEPVQKQGCAEATLAQVRCVEL